MRVRGLLVAGVIGGAIVLGGASPAAAGGSWFDTVRDTHQPGDTVTLVGFTGGGSQGWVEDGPFYGYLQAADATATIVTGPRIPVGELTLDQTGRGGYLSLRASITFTLPGDLAPGTYQFDYCNEGCHEKLGDLVGGAVHVGVDPPRPIAREWPLDDPEVANLAPDAVLSGPGYGVTAGDVRAGRLPLPSPPGPPDPPPTTTSSTTTTTTTTTTTSTTTAQELDDAALAVGGPTTGTSSGSATSTTAWVVAGGAVVVAGAAGTTAAARDRRSRR
jgi:hypothetical protein